MTSTADAEPSALDPETRSTAAPRRKAPPRRWLRLALFLLLPIVLIVLALLYVSGGQITAVDDAYVEADKVAVSTDVSGIVKSVEVADNQTVAAGQVLYRLDDEPYRLALLRAQGQAGTIRDELNAQKANYRDFDAQIAQARTDVAYYAKEFGRQRDLYAAHIVSEASFDAARRNLDAARQKVASLAQQQAAVGAGLNGAPSGPPEENPRYLQAKAEGDEAARQLAHTVVRAPFAGVATGVPSIAPGRYLAAAATAFYIVSADHVWVDAVPKETELTYVRVGQPATVKVDAYPSVTWRGVVQSISPAAAQEFALLPAQNSSGNWVKVVQRIPMRIRVDTADRSLPPLRAGMSVQVRVDTGHRRGLPRLLGGPAPRYGR